MNYSDMEILVRQQCSRYPKLHVQDLVKAMYQAEFGCGHFVASPEKALDWIVREENELHLAGKPAASPFIEPIGSDYCRVHLHALHESGLSARTLCRLFCLSGSEPDGDMAHFESCLDLLQTLIASGGLPVDIASSLEWIDAYRASGCPATHHLDAFRGAYAPAYRVIRTEYARLIPLLARIDRLCAEKNQVIVAIEGGSASGKTTLAAQLDKIYDINLFHMDDFFLQKHQRTPERFAEPGGNVDRERFLEEVLEPLQRNNPFTYRVFDCSVMDLGELVQVQPKQLNIVEGAYSTHPSLASAYDLSVFLRIDPDAQAARILERNGPIMQQRFLNEWIPLEKAYFEATGLPARCDLILSTEE